MDRMRPANEICETCHSTQKVREDKVKVIRHFNDDEKSSEKDTVLLMRIGSKIHKAHIGRRIEYLSLTSDPQTIPTVVADGSDDPAVLQSIEERAHRIAIVPLELQVELRVDRTGR